MPSGSLPRLTETRISHYLNLARNACYYSDFMKARLGAVLIYKGKVMSVGWNSTKTSPLQKSLNKFRHYELDCGAAHHTLHAEVACLAKVRDLDIDWGRASLFICRIKKDIRHGCFNQCHISNIIRCLSHHTNISNLDVSGMVGCNFWRGYNGCT